MKEIALIGKRGKGFFAKVDDNKYDELIKYKWYLNKGRKTDYAFANKNGKRFYMHRVVLGVTEKRVRVDHKNRNGLDNQIHNLRKSTQSENMRNRKSVENATSKYKGVDWHKEFKTWRARIKLDYKEINLGTYKDEEFAAKVYDYHALIFHGEFACLNFPHLKEEYLSNSTKYEYIRHKKTSKFLGVTWRSDSEKWQAFVVIKRRAKKLGCFKNEEGAAKVRDKAVLKYGIRSRLNFPEFSNV